MSYPCTTKLSIFRTISLCLRLSTINTLGKSQSIMQQNYTVSHSQASRFRFINIRSLDDATTEKNRSAVRSHAARTRRHYVPMTSARSPGFLATLGELFGNHVSPSIMDEARTDSQAREVTLQRGMATLETIPPTIGGLRFDPFRSYPIPWTSALPCLIDHYLQHMAVDIPALDGPRDTGLLRKSWFPFIMTQEAPFAVVLLISASHKATVCGQMASVDLLQLRVQAVKCLQRALDDRQACTSDHVIAAVAKFASYEAMYGERQSYEAHMQGLQRLIHMRGGIGELGLHGLLARMITWIDNHGAFMTGSSQYFNEDTEDNGSCISHFLAMC